MSAPGSDQPRDGAAPANPREQRVLVLAPTGRDADLTGSVLQRAGISCARCSGVVELCAQMDDGASAVLLAEEALSPEEMGRLAEWIGRQPRWSDLPVVVLARSGADSIAVAQAMDLLGNVTVLERPTRVAGLVSTVRSALRARSRQYQIRDYLAERDRVVASQAFLAAIVESSDDAIVSKTLDGIILTWNAGAARLFGYNAEEVIGKSITILIPPDRQFEEPQVLERLRRGECVDHYETVRVTKDGRLLDISLTISPIRDSEGRIIAASKVARDVTQAKRAAQVLREADRRKDEFLAVLAHELRNPLAPIRNSLHILRLTSRHDPAAERVGEMMERQVNHMVRLVDDLMEVSRITRGKIELRREPIEVAAVVRSAAETSRPVIEAVGHQLALALPPEPLVLYVDPVRLSQVLANLLNNAAKYTDPGGQIWLTARREDDAAIISVRDNGTGIPPEMLPRIFEFFTQVDRHIGRAQGGLGIGLTLVRSLVELHGGSVEAHSEGAGQGSEFILRLPLAPAGYATEAPDKDRAPAAVFSRRRVLVVDDNRDAAESLGTLLRLLGGNVKVVYSGPEALAAVAEFRPAVVLLDIGMPGMDGHEVARRIRQQSDFRDVTLIALTGWGQEEDRSRSRLAGFDYHLIKPADVNSLQTLLMSLEPHTSDALAR